MFQILLGENCGIIIMEKLEKTFESNILSLSLTQNNNIINNIKKIVYENNLNYVSEGVVDLLGPRYLYLVVDDFNNNVNNNFYSAFNSSILNKNILARISLQAATFNIFTENNLSIVTTPRQYFGPVKIQNINVQLLDEYGRVIDLNNMDYSFSLTFQTVYDL